MEQHVCYLKSWPEAAVAALAKMGRPGAEAACSFLEDKDGSGFFEGFGIVNTPAEAP